MALDGYTVDSDELYMSLAVDISWRYQTLALPNPTVTCLVLRGSEIISVGVHKKAGDAHAELSAIAQAYIKLGGDPSVVRTEKDFKDSHSLFMSLKEHHMGMFHDCEVFVTLEPCNHIGRTPPCSELLSEIKPRRVIIGAKEYGPKASGGASTISDRGIEVRSGVLARKNMDLLYPFHRLSKYGKFTLFKIATRLDGSYTNGRISNESSRIFTHNQRSVANNIIVSGKTIVKDNPILDNRHADHEYKGIGLPKVYVMSKRLESFSGYNVYGRKPSLIDEPSKLELTGFSIIEGGVELLNTLRGRVDALMGFISPEFVNLDRSTLEENLGYKLMHASTIGNECEDDNIVYWLKPQ